MAKLLMSCDDYIYLYKGRYYAGSRERMEFYQRYLRVFEELRLCTRCKPVISIKEGAIPLDSDPRIEYVALPFFQGPKQYAKAYFKFRNINKIIEGCDAAIMRLPSTVAQRICNKVQKSGIPFATEIVYDAYDAYNSSKGLLSKCINGAIHYQMKRSCSMAWGVSCVTESYLQKHYYSKKAGAFTSHYSSLALDKSFYTSARKFPAKEILTLTNVANQVVFNGRKGFKQIIEAIKILDDKGVKVEAKFVGGDYNGGIEKLTNYARELGVDDRIYFLGYQNRDSLSKILDEVDLYVMPTKAEGLPRTVIEAMAKGLPVITTPVSGNPEMVTERYLVEFYDVNKLADRIEELITHPEIYENVSRLNFEKSHKYEASILQGRRDKFYSQLKCKI